MNTFPMFIDLVVVTCRYRETNKASKFVQAFIQIVPSKVILIKKKYVDNIYKSIMHIQSF